ALLLVACGQRHGKQEVGSAMSTRCDLELGHCSQGWMAEARIIVCFVCWAQRYTGGSIPPLPRNLGDPEPEPRIAAVGGIHMPFPCFLNDTLELGVRHETPNPCRMASTSSYVQSNIMAQLGTPHCYPRNNPVLKVIQRQSCLTDLRPRNRYAGEWARASLRLPSAPQSASQRPQLQPQPRLPNRPLQVRRPALREPRLPPKRRASLEASEKITGGS